MPHFAVKSFKQRSQLVTNLLQLPVSITFRKQKTRASKREKRTDGNGTEEEGTKKTVAKKADIY